MTNTTTTHTNTNTTNDTATILVRYGTKWVPLQTELGVPIGHIDRETETNIWLRQTPANIAELVGIAISEIELDNIDPSEWQDDIKACRRVVVTAKRAAERAGWDWAQCEIAAMAASSKRHAADVKRQTDYNTAAAANAVPTFDFTFPNPTSMTLNEAADIINSNEQHIQSISTLGTLGWSTESTTKVVNRIVATDHYGNQRGVRSGRMEIGHMESIMRSAANGFFECEIRHAPDNDINPDRYLSENYSQQLFIALMVSFNHWHAWNLRQQAQHERDGIAALHQDDDERVRWVETQWATWCHQLDNEMFDWQTHQ